MYLEYNYCLLEHKFMSSNCITIALSISDDTVPQKFFLNNDPFNVTFCAEYENKYPFLLL